MGDDHSSVPRWPYGTPPVDGTARSLDLVAFGPGCDGVLAGWRADVPAGVPVGELRAHRADADALARFAERLVNARVGWRLMLVGPEVDVLAARATAVHHGALDAEIRVAVTSTDRKRVFCPHCRTTTETTVGVGARTPCSGCMRSLHVYGHVSRRLGSYLGFMADAEEVA